MLNIISSKGNIHYYVHYYITKQEKKLSKQNFEMYNKQKQKNVKNFEIDILVQDYLRDKHYHFKFVWGKKNEF